MKPSAAGIWKGESEREEGEGAKRLVNNTPTRESWLPVQAACLSGQAEQLRSTSTTACTSASHAGMGNAWNLPAKMLLWQTINVWSELLNDKETLKQTHMWLHVRMLGEGEQRARVHIYRKCSKERNWEKWCRKWYRFQSLLLLSWKSFDSVPFINKSTSEEADTLILPAIHRKPSENKLQLQSTETNGKQWPPAGVNPPSLRLSFVRFSRRMMLSSINHQTAREHKLHSNEGRAEVAH